MGGKMDNKEFKKIIDTAKKSKKFMMAIWHIEDDKIILNRITEQFPVADIGTSLELLKQDLKVVERETPKAIRPPKIIEPRVLEVKNEPE
jgi:hypothetical protein